MTYASAPLSEEMKDNLVNSYVEKKTSIATLSLLYQIGAKKILEVFKERGVKIRQRGWYLRNN